MSDLFKKLHKKGPPPKKEDNDDDSGNEDEENKDSMEIEAPKISIPIKPTESFKKPPVKSAGPDLSLKFKPDEWPAYFDTLEYTSNGTSLFTAGTEGPIFICLHGAGHSALSFACLAKEIKRWGICVAFDFRGHGFSKIEKDKKDLSLQTLINDTLDVLDYLDKKYKNSCFIILGHSMGGSIAAKATEQALKQPYEKKIQGLVVIDVVEGTAMEALPFMEQVVSSRPVSFPTLEKAIEWSIRSSTLKNLISAKVSIPPQLTPVVDDKGDVLKYKWKVDLLESQNYWIDWFKDLTKCFLSIRIPKLLLLAEKDRMDKELTIAQMQGKFKLVVLYNVGHVMQEDDPLNAARNLHGMITQFKIPVNLDELDEVSKQGIGKFHPKIKNFN